MIPAARPGAGQLVLQEIKPLVMLRSEPGHIVSPAGGLGHGPPSLGLLRFGAKHEATEPRAEVAVGERLPAPAGFARALGPEDVDALEGVLECQVLPAGELEEAQIEGILGVGIGLRADAGPLIHDNLPIHLCGR